MIHTGFVTRVDREHEARCIEAIRTRWASEAQFRPLPWFRQRDDAGRFQKVAGR